MAKKPKTRNAKEERSLNRFCLANGIKRSKKGVSFYFEIDGKKYRVSDHTIEESKQGQLLKAQMGTVLTGRDIVPNYYHNEEKDEGVIQIDAPKNRLIQIYKDIQSGYQVDREGKRVIYKEPEVRIVLVIDKKSFMKIKKQTQREIYRDRTDYWNGRLEKYLGTRAEVEFRDGITNYRVLVTECDITKGIDQKTEEERFVFKVCADSPITVEKKRIKAESKMTEKGEENGKVVKNKSRDITDLLFGVR